MPSLNPFKRMSSRKSNNNQPANDLLFAPQPSSSSSSRPRSTSSSKASPFGRAASATRRPSPGPSVPAAAGETPPPYTPATHGTIVPGNMATNPDNQFAFLSKFDTKFVIDDSGSMAGRSWRETADALASIAGICTMYDSDGIDIYFLNERHSSEYENVTTKETVQQIFNAVRPRGGTPTGCRLDAILRPYLRACEQKGPENCKPINVIVITDGVPTDDVESPIIAAAKKLDKLDAPAWQVGIQFFQIGDERGAAEALRELDDQLAETGDVRDMVDTVPWNGGEGLTADKILKCVLGAVHRRWDRKTS
ncbi:MAG: hypothetical protein LQ346_003692 [Caloplaca aetnensis]|nr:MAG: hypothetical protein LQ346_003692 [Caloplaca aetnensis]